MENLPRPQTRRSSPAAARAPRRDPCGGLNPPPSFAGVFRWGGAEGGRGRVAGSAWPASGLPRARAGPQHLEKLRIVGGVGGYSRGHGRENSRGGGENSRGGGGTWRNSARAPQNTAATCAARRAVGGGPRGARAWAAALTDGGAGGAGSEGQPLCIGRAGRRARRGGRGTPPPPSLPYKVDTSRPSLRTNWTRLRARRGGRGTPCRGAARRRRGRAARCATRASPPPAVRRAPTPRARPRTCAPRRVRTKARRPALSEGAVRRRVVAAGAVGEAPGV